MGRQYRDIASFLSPYFLPLPAPTVPPAPFRHSPFPSLLTSFPLPVFSFSNLTLSSFSSLPFPSLSFSYNGYGVYRRERYSSPSTSGWSPAAKHILMQSQPTLANLLMFHHVYKDHYTRLLRF